MELIITLCNMYKNPQIFDKLQCVFIHVPKVAGTSIEMKLKELNDKRQIIGGHSSAFSLLHNMPKIYKNYFTFSIVRHPYHRLYSAYNYLCKMDTHENLGNKNIKSFETFEDFTMNYLTKETINQNIHLKPQTYFLCHKQDVIVDYWEKYENIKIFWKVIELKLKIKCVLPWLNKTKSEKKYEFPDRIKLKIFDLYKDDFEKFGYEQ